MVMALLAGRYDVVAEMGSGNEARVYRAVDAESGQVVAVKVFTAGGAIDAETLLRLERHGAHLTALRHPNLVSVLSTHPGVNVCSIVMEFVEGQSLRAMLTSGRNISLPYAKDLLTQVAAALAYLHERGIVHGDVRPENVLVAEGGPAKVTNFGIASVLQESGRIPGSLPYTAPELFDEVRLDGRADIYSFGAVMYEMVTHRPPDYDLSLERHDDEGIPAGLPGHLPQDWEKVILRCLAPDPRDRFQSASALAHAIHALSTEHDVVRRPSQPLVPDAAVTDPRVEEREREVRARMRQGEMKELSGDLAGALAEYDAALALSPPAGAREELTARIALVRGEIEGKPKPAATAAGRSLHRAGLAALGAAVVAAIALAAWFHWAPGAARSAQRSAPLHLRTNVTSELRHSAPLFGPKAGVIPDNGVLWTHTHQGIGDFAAAVRFDNPRSSKWQYGLWFRNVPGMQFRLTLNSSRHYSLYYHDMNGGSMQNMGPMLHRVDSGTIKTIDTSRGGFNDVTLVVSGTSAALVVNGAMLPKKLNVADSVMNGDVGVDAIGAPVRFTDFTVWPLGMGSPAGKAGNVTGTDEFVSAGVDTRDFVATAQFLNPSAGVWQYGLQFRNTVMGGAYHLTLNSNRTYTLYLHEMQGNVMRFDGAVRSGRLPDLNTAPGGTNDMTLIVADKSAWLLVNGKDALALPASKMLSKGDVGVTATALPQAGRVGFSHFNVWPVLD